MWFAGANYRQVGVVLVVVLAAGAPLPVRVPR
jgi:hypothetical protein